jgi:hypothetical protein
MAKRGDFSSMIGKFDASLDKWQEELARAKSTTRYSKAARLHAEHSREWLKPILDNPDTVKLIKNQDVVRYMEEAVKVVGNPKSSPRKETIIIASTVIDKAIDCTYKVLRDSGVEEGGFSVAEPITYGKALTSILPGNPDFPTDDSTPDATGKSSGGKWSRE